MHKKEIIAGLLAALFLAFFLSPFASSFPDGLERVAEDKGFLEKGEGVLTFPSPVPDYTFPNQSNKGLATSMAGLTGTLIVFGLGYGLATFLKKKEPR